MNGTYIAIDLKSFYASVECRRLNLEPLDVNLVVADKSRTDKTICLAVTPSLKAMGISGRPRMFQVISAVREINEKRLKNAPGHRFRAKSFKASELASDPSLELDYIVATPHMAMYMEISSRIYDVYLNYVSADDIHVYSVDEVFMDVSGYLNLYGMTARGLVMTMIRDVLYRTGITATAGIGSNLYLCKVAMDIVAKHIPPDKDGVRIAELDEMSYRRLLWSHTPITDFWRVGRGYSSRLAAFGMDTMGDVARMSIENEKLLYDLFGINAEILIDHAWGWENCTIKQIKAYRPQSSSLSTGQVLSEGYSFEKGCLIVKEMADSLAFDILDKGLLTCGLELYAGYDAKLSEMYSGPYLTDRYGRTVPRSVHASERFDCYTSSAARIRTAAEKLYRKTVNRKLLVKRLNLCVCDVIPEGSESSFRIQGELFDVDDKLPYSQDIREKRRMLAVIGIKKRFGKNAILRGMDFEKGATAAERNNQIGGHRA